MHFVNITLEKAQRTRNSGQDMSYLQQHLSKQSSSLTCTRNRPKHEEGRNEKPKACFSRKAPPSFRRRRTCFVLFFPHPPHIRLQRDQKLCAPTTTTELLSPLCWMLLVLIGREQRATVFKCGCTNEYQAECIPVEMH